MSIDIKDIIFRLTVSKSQVNEEDPVKKDEEENNNLLEMQLQQFSTDSNDNECKSPQIQQESDTDE